MFKDVLYLAQVVALVALVSECNVATAQAGAVTHVPVVFSGGHDTDPQDRGRPVALVAGALGIPAQVFRDAFSRVKPAPAGTQPSGDRARENKAVLMSALGKYGITNERLDEVSNYYRYNRQRGEMWPAKPASANALVHAGKIVSFEITNGGAGYNSPPAASVKGIAGASASTQLLFDKELARNGSITTITLAAKP